MAEATYSADLTPDAEAFPDEMGEEQPDFSAMQKLENWTASKNIAAELDEHETRSYGNVLAEEIEIDKKSMAQWAMDADKALMLGMFIMEEKTFPWPGASNVSLPLIVTAALKFASKAYAKLLGGDEWVKTEHPGLRYMDEEMANSLTERSKRVAEFMDYELRHSVKGWESSFDQLLNTIPWVGGIHKKNAFDPATGKFITRLLTHKNLIINQGTNDTNAERARYTEIIEVSANEYQEWVETGYYLPLNTTENEVSGYADTDKMMVLYESDCWIDLDGDGYKEPYVVTMRRATNQIVRIATRFDPDDVMATQQGKIQSIKPSIHITKYGMFPAPDTSYWPRGWGHMALGMNEAANALLNQLIDAGTLSNANPGMVDERLRTVDGGDWLFEPGEYKRVTGFNGRSLSDAIHELHVGEPSGTLFSALELLISQIEKLATSPEMIAESTASTAPVGTTLARIEEAERVANGVDKRLNLSMTHEFEVVYDLFRRYGDPAHYMEVLNLKEQIPQPEWGEAMKADFARGDLDVLPTANPDMSSTTMRIVQAEVVKQTSAEFVALGVQVDMSKVYIEVLASSGVEEPSRFLAPPPTPEQEAAAEMQQAAEELTIEQTIEKQEEEINNLRAETDLLIAQRQTELKKPGQVVAETVKTTEEAEHVGDTPPAPTSGNSGE